MLIDKERIEVNTNRMKVKVNDVEVSLKEAHLIKNDDGQVVAQIRRPASMEGIEINSPTHMIRVVFDERTAAVSASAVHRGRLCRLCGTADGDRTSDLQGPRRCPLTGRLMGAAYELQRPAGCRGVAGRSDAGELQRLRDRCQQRRAQASTPASLWPRWQHGLHAASMGRSASSCTYHRNKMSVAEDGRTCFSTEAPPKCAIGCKPVDVIDKKVGTVSLCAPVLCRLAFRFSSRSTSLTSHQLAFHCPTERNVIDHLKQEMTFRPLDEVNGKEISFVQTFSVPAACIPA